MIHKKHPTQNSLAKKANLWKNSYLLLTLALFTSTLLFAQKKEAEKWGKISDADLAMTVYPQDSAASAVILQDVGDILLRFSESGITTEFKQHRRIKVFDLSAFSEGNLLIPYYSYDGAEKMIDLDVQLILPNGEKQRVKSENVFTEKISKYRSAKKVFVPNLQKGCIIEYRFVLRSDYITTLHDWYFQHELPVRWSEVTVRIPQYFNYVFLKNKPYPFDVEETYDKREGAGNYMYDTKATRYGLQNLPAVKEEPFMTTLDDYRAHIGFQLATVEVPGKNIQKYMTSWGDLAKKLEERDDFGEQYLREGKSKNLWAAFSKTGKPASSEPAEAVAERVLRFLTSNIKWNGFSGYTVEKGIDDAFEKKLGSTADLNLALVALLRHCGLTAMPVLTSTRDNGQMYPVYPFRNQFNAVLAFVRTPSGGFLLDATDPSLPVGQLNDRHYNTMGWIVDKDHPDWVDVIAPESSATWLGALTLSETGEMAGQFTLSIAGPMAADWRNELAKTTLGKDVLKTHFATEFPDIMFDSVTISEKTAYDMPLKITFHCRVPSAGNAVNDFIYFRPVLDFLVDKNPFKTLNRTFPVNFNYPLKFNYVLNLKVPAGYKLEAPPAPVRISLENNGGKINFSCAEDVLQSIQIVLKMSISQLEFKPNEYASLRHFFDLATEKAHMQLALKKT